MAVEITFERGLKIWWSYTWRTLVMLGPLLLLMMYFLPGAVAPAPTSGAAADPMGESQGGGNPLLLLLIMAVNVILQVQALRWMLKTRWSDFRLEAVSSTPAASDRTE